eukprot:gene2539-4109_t
MSSQSETNGANEAEQIEVLALAGQGAFGTVYVANWKGMYVAVKVMKQQTDGRKTMRTAWELAVTKSVSHRNVVTVSGGGLYLRVTVQEVAEWKGMYVAVKVMKQQTDGRKTMRTAWELAVTKSVSHRNVVTGVANEDGMYVAVKVMKQQTDGRKSMRTAWELAVTKSVSHRNVVTVLALLTDVAVKRVSRGIIQFVTKHGSSEPGTRRPSPSNSGSHAQAPTEVQPSCQSSVSDSRGFVTKVTDFGLSDLYTCTIMWEMYTWQRLYLEYLTAAQQITQVSSCIIMWEMYIWQQPYLEYFTAPPSNHAGIIMWEMYIWQQPYLEYFTSPPSNHAGIIMWEMYTWQRPYLEYLKSSTEKSVMEKAILTNVAHEQVRPIFPSTTPPDYERLAKTCWLAEPLSRPTFSEVMAELRYMQEMCNHATAPDSRSSRSFSGTALQ